MSLIAEPFSSVPRRVSVQSAPGLSVSVTREFVPNPLGQIPVLAVRVT